MPATEVADDFAEEISAPESPPARPAKRLKLPWLPAISALIVAQPLVMLSPNKTDRNWPIEKHLATTIDVPFLIDFQEQLFQINGSGSGVF
ncbi:hypothetical protein PTT_12940 [Pyrenophora teres f. teres 0-1]|uniref:Uncharacterized protein n=1 Tax=Pyrenophora teres f. teres (strain 0-1) TaxID=861557 RepID=E3RUZ4_PYRTT|nr:hypothetical protein PTT_12940 [Pyrenophora teres f. teres 0-1]